MLIKIYQTANDALGTFNNFNQINPFDTVLYFLKSFRPITPPDFPSQSFKANELIFPKNAVLDATVGEHPDTLAVIVVVLEHSDIVLAAREENSSVSVQLIVRVLAFVNLVVVEHLAANSFKQLTVFLELPNVHFVWELHLFELDLPVVKAKVFVLVADNVLDRQRLELLPILN